MKKYLVMMLAVAAAAAALILSAFRVVTAPPAPVPVHGTLRAKPSAYLGTFEIGAPPSYRPVQEFATAAGQQPNLVGYFSGWAEPFAAPFARMLSARHITPLVQIDPSLAPVREIAAGDYDSYLRSFADSVADFRHPVVIGFGHEMNAPWYPWGYGHVPPRVFVAAWRHIVTLFHQEGAGNVIWLWTINANDGVTGPITSWWPGDQYVTWIGVDGFYSRPGDTFQKIFAPTLSAIRAFTDKPVLISETAVTPHADPGRILNLFTGVRREHALGLMWFDIAQHSGTRQQDWRVEDGTTAAQSAFRFGAHGLRLTRP